MITYPPELLPRCAPEDQATVIVYDSSGKTQLIIPAPSTPREEALRKLLLARDLS